MGNKFISQMHLIVLNTFRLTYSTCGPFAKNKERIKKIKETNDSQYIYQNEVDKASLQHGMAQGDFQDLTRRAASDKILRYKTFSIEKNPKYDRYQRGLASMVYNQNYTNQLLEN